MERRFYDPCSPLYFVLGYGFGYLIAPHSSSHHQAGLHSSVLTSASNWKSQKLDLQNGKSTRFPEDPTNKSVDLIGNMNVTAAATRLSTLERKEKAVTVIGLLCTHLHITHVYVYTWVDWNTYTSVLSLFYFMCIHNFIPIRGYRGFN